MHVSIVNWIKGTDDGTPKTLFELTGNDRQGPWRAEELPSINSSLSFATDVSEAKRLRANVDAKACFQGQTHGHKGFLLLPDRAIALYKDNDSNRDVIFPFLTANDMLSTFPPSPKRYVIDFHPRDLIESSKYTKAFEVVKRLVLPAREQAAKKEEDRNKSVLKENPEAKVNMHHSNFLKQWWLLSWAREEMIERIKRLSRYIVCGQVTKRPIFEFVSPEIHPNAACMVFPFEDDYSFGILQSNVHWAWFVAKCSTLTERFRYTSDTVFDTFPWPQSPTSVNVRLVAEASRALRDARRKSMQEAGLNLRKLYRLAELPGKNSLKTAQADLDEAVQQAYGMRHKDNALPFLLSLNAELFREEGKGGMVQAPGPPSTVKDLSQLVSRDRMEAPQTGVHKFGSKEKKG